MWLLLPIGTDRQIYGIPWCTVVLLALCVIIQVASSLGLFDPIAVLGMVPSEGASHRLLLYAFAHGGWFHLVVNMFFLWCMGINLEYRWGWPTFAAVYLLGGVAAAISFSTLHPTSDIPLVGASGAIASAMGAFLVSLFKTRITFWYAYFLLRFRHGTFAVPAYVVLPFWFLLDLLGIYVETARGGGGVAYSAHVGGFVTGFIAAAALRLSGMEKRLVDASGADAFEDPSKLTQLPLEGSDTSVKPPPIGAQPPPIGAQPPPIGAQPPPMAAQPLRCNGCGLVNMPDASACRRCGSQIAPPS